MFSDDVSTYKVAVDELKKLLHLEEICTNLGQGTIWKFIPKKAQWFSGFRERLIGLMKTTIKKILERTHVSLQMLQTIVVEIEMILNNRQLIYLSDDMQDQSPLPHHICCTEEG